MSQGKSDFCRKSVMGWAELQAARIRMKTNRAIFVDDVLLEIIRFHSYINIRDQSRGDIIQMYMDMLVGADPPISALTTAEKCEFITGEGMEQWDIRTMEDFVQCPPVQMALVALEEGCETEES